MGGEVFFLFLFLLLLLTLITLLWLILIFFSGLYMDVVLVITNSLHIVLFSENLLLLLPFCFIFNEALTFKFGQGVLNNSNTKATAAEGVPGRERRP